MPRRSSQKTVQTNNINAAKASRAEPLPRVKRSELKELGLKFGTSGFIEAGELSDGSDEDDSSVPVISTSWAASTLSICLEALLGVLTTVCCLHYLSHLPRPLPTGVDLLESTSFFHITSSRQLGSHRHQER